jgi:hypothetical protein
MGGKAEEARVLREEARQLREEVTGKKRLEILLQDMREKLHHLGNRSWHIFRKCSRSRCGSGSVDLNVRIIGTVRTYPDPEPNRKPANNWKKDPRFFS